MGSPGVRRLRRVALLPLDERPCNWMYPQLLGRVAGLEVEVPPRELMGLKKRPGCVQAIAEWLEAAGERADALVVAAETLVYGGLVPSRVTTVPWSEARRRLEVLERIHRRRPEVPIFVQTVILRLPAYDSDDEEPDYWATYGARIHLYSVTAHIVSSGESLWEGLRRGPLGPSLPGDLQPMTFAQVVDLHDRLRAQIPRPVLEDFHARREEHHRLNQEFIDLAASGTIDFLALTQDDSFPLGFPAWEQRALKARIAEHRAFRRALIYPGADETGLVLLARHAVAAVGRRPKVALRFSSAAGPLIIARYEDRPLLESIKNQLNAAGGLVEPGREAEILLFVNSPDGPQQEAPDQEKPGGAVGSGRTLHEFLEALAASLGGGTGPVVALADVAYGNGADCELLEMLPAYADPLQLGAYAGWNTASNTVGTAVAQAVLRWASGLPEDGALDSGDPSERDRAHELFLMLRFLEDWGYQAVVRQQLAATVAGLGLSPYRLDAHGEGLAGEGVRRLTGLMDRWLAGWPEAAAGRARRVEIGGLRFPWNRLFEAELDLRWSPTNGPGQGGGS